MNKSIIDNLKDEEIIKIANQSRSFADFTTQIGYSQRKVGKTTRIKIKNRLKLLNIDFTPQSIKQKFNTQININKNISIGSEELGFLGEASLMKLAVTHGIHVSRPVVDAYPYDFILERNNKFLKIQVKTSQNFDGSTVFFHLTSNLHNGVDKKYSITDVDYFYLYNVILDEAYIIKNTGTLSSKSVRCNKLYSKNTSTLNSTILAENIIKDII